MDAEAMKGPPAGQTRHPAQRPSNRAPATEGAALGEAVRVLADQRAAITRRLGAEGKPAGFPASGGAFIWRHVKRRPWAFAALLLLVTAGAACSVGVQYGMKLIVDEMAIGDRVSMDVWRFVALFAALIAAESVLWRLGGWHGSRMVISTGVDVRLDLFERLAGQSMGFFGRQMSGALGGRIPSAAQAVGAVIGELTWHVVPPCVDFIGAIVVLTSIDWRMAAALVGFAAVAFVVVSIFGLRGKALHRHFAERQASATGQLVDAVANIWTIKAFSLHRPEQQRLAGTLEDEARAHRQSWMHTEKARVIHDVLLWLLAGGMLAWAIEGWRIGERSAGDVVIISALTFRILHGSRDLALSLVGLHQQMGVLNEVIAIVGSARSVDDEAGARPLRVQGGSIRFDQVSYGYPDNELLFDKLDLEIPAGQHVGIVGPSGSGKSTLVSLIQRLDDVSAGRVLIDGQPLRSVTQESLRDAMAVVPQDVGLFHRSIAENLHGATPGSGDVRAQASMHDAACEFVDELPNGDQTLVGERGVRLSGGQRQRLGIARALFKDAPIYIFDEATAALDSLTEQRIQQALATRLSGRTVVAVSHRLSTVDGFDRVIVMENGRVVEDGPPGELRQAGGLYAKLWAMQSKGLETT